LATSQIVSPGIAVTALPSRVNVIADMGVLLVVRVTYTISTHIKTGHPRPRSAHLRHVLFPKRNLCPCIDKINGPQFLGHQDLSDKKPWRLD
jgi:hypothetical protein